MKKACSILLAALILLSTVFPVSGAVQEPSVSPLWVNTSQAKVAFGIDEEGTATIVVTCIGQSTATDISTTTYLERKVGSSWVRVDVGTTDNNLLYSTTASYMHKTYTLTLTVKGEYRVTTEFTVYGTVEDETFTLTNTCDYT